MASLRLKNDTYTLSTGREFYANRGILGMSPEFAGEGDTYANGYDSTDNTRKSYPEDLTKDWTQGERQELADYISALWQMWATHVPIPEPVEDTATDARLARANKSLQRP